MADSYTLTELDPNSFEHLANFIALKVLGPGHTSFGPGPDGGRDGFFEGEAPYPSPSDRWSGRWYIQAKFHKPHLSQNPQRWLVNCVKEELKEFRKPDTKRTLPDNWIIVTNIDPSGAPETGAFDTARRAVARVRPQLAARFHIWGGRKVLDFLALYPEIAEYYSHFLTPGHVLSALYNQIKDSQAEIPDVLRYLIATRFTDQQYTKLEQAGATTDTRPGIHRLFTDLPFESVQNGVAGMAAQSLAMTAAQNHRVDQTFPETPEWAMWRCHPNRARVWFIRGGPGQGKSTLTQYLCQVHRAALLLQPCAPPMTAAQRNLANEIKTTAIRDVWPSVPRIPFSVELRDFAQWFGECPTNQPHGVLTYLADRLSAGLEQKVHPGTLKRAFSFGGWMFIFDGLDEVPSDVKDKVAEEVIHFIDDVLIGCKADALTVCTSRPQGYSGQFSALTAPLIELSMLSPTEALACAEPLLEIERTHEESKEYLATLQKALEIPSVQSIMTTPLQAHIMAIVVRDGGRPPDRKWQLFTNFYQVIKKREANRNLSDQRLARLLREGGKLIKSLHNRLGFELHARAETSKGAQTSLNRDELRILVGEVVSKLQEHDIDNTVETLMEATTERLVLVSTPETGEAVRFDIRPLQEFFAAEFIYEDANSDEFSSRINIIAGDSHWREVMHFLLSGLIENTRQTELSVAVNTLVSLDDSEDPGERLLRRRLAIGAGLAARLLQEGVLEEDKRTRQQFRRCIEPLFASTDVGLCYPLLNVSQTHSQSWLFDVLVDYLRDSAETEHIGAGMVTSLVLPDNHSRVEEAVSLLTKTSLDYRRQLFIAIAPPGNLGSLRLSHKAEKVPLWVCAFVFRTLLDSGWTALGPEGVYAALSILSARKEYIQDVAIKLGFSERLALLCPLFLFYNRHQTERDVVFTEQFGFVTRSYYWPDPKLDYQNWSDEVWQELSKTTGVPQCICRVLQFAKKRSIEEFRNLRSYLDQVSLEAGMLPWHVRVFLPKGLPAAYVAYDQPEQLPNELNEDDLGKCFSHPSFGHIPEFRLESGHVQRFRASDWSQLINELPSFALDLFGDLFLNDEVDLKVSANVEKSSRSEIASELVRKCLDKCELLLHYPAYWGSFIFLCPELSADLRAGIISVADKPITQQRTFSYVTSFEIRLPMEAPLLPHVLNSLVMESLPGGPLMSRGPHMLEDELEIPARKRELLSFQIAQMIVEPHPLIDIMLNQSLSRRVRIAAAMLYLLHPHSDTTQRDSCKEHLRSLYATTIGPWCLRAAAVALQGDIEKNSFSAVTVMGQLLQQSRTDFKARWQLDSVLQTWRETSKAPVHAAENPKLWK